MPTYLVLFTNSLAYPFPHIRSFKGNNKKPQEVLVERCKCNVGVQADNGDPRAKTWECTTNHSRKQQHPVRLGWKYQAQQRISTEGTNQITILGLLELCRAVRQVAPLYYLGEQRVSDSNSLLGIIPKGIDGTSPEAKQILIPAEEEGAIDGHTDSASVPTLPRVRMSLFFNTCLISLVSYTQWRANHFSNCIIKVKSEHLILDSMLILFPFNKHYGWIGEQENKRFQLEFFHLGQKDINSN